MCQCEKNSLEEKGLIVDIDLTDRRLMDRWIYLIRKSVEKLEI